MGEKTYRVRLHEDALKLVTEPSKLGVEREGDELVGNYKAMKRLRNALEHTPADRTRAQRTAARSARDAVDAALDAGDDAEGASANPFDPRDPY